MKKLAIAAFLGITLSLFAATEASAQKKVKVRFARGDSSAELSGRIYGYKYVDYLVTASEDQQMSVRMTSGNRFANFVIFDPKMENLEGATGETEYNGRLPQSGEYVIRVLMSRNEARRKNAKADYSLTIAIE